MTYDLTFDRKRGFLTLACLGLAAVLLGVAGFLIGNRDRRPLQAAFPAKAAVLPPLLKPAPKAVKTGVTRSEPVAASAPGGAAAPAVGSAATSSRAAAASGESGPPATFTLQYGAFRDKSNADALVKSLKDGGIAATVSALSDPGGALWFAVRSGQYASSGEAAQAAAAASQSGHAMAIIRPAQSL